ncbi:hypothetical protein BY458DRAFT_591334 [Sporodiniella umbellata]|nr:hypothetical protein BY458DRAFT_591334 [Sporodiniella umbellata]
MSNLSNLLNINKENQDLDQPTFLSTEKKTYQLSSSSDVLSRVQAFLPKIQQANEILKHEDASKLDIENVDKDAEQYIEMNLGLGVYDTKKEGENTDEDCSDSEEEQVDIKLPSSTKNPDKKPIIELMETENE